MYVYSIVKYQISQKMVTEISRDLTLRQRILWFCIWEKNVPHVMWRLGISMVDFNKCSYGMTYHECHLAGILAFQ